MKLHFLGANGTVTGSKQVLEVNGQNYMIDCGLYQGIKNYRQRNWAPLPVYPADLKAVFLTHAHIDHSGYLPLLVKNGFRGPIYATDATIALCGILLPDSGHLQEEDADYANKKGFSKHEEAKPLYTAEDARKSLKYLESVGRGGPVEVGDEVTVNFLTAGHILGSSMVHVQFAGRSILFTGDLGRMTAVTMNPPETVHKTDFLVLESTYGNRLHGESDPEVELGNVIRETYDEGGRLLIPAFAVGRSQKLLFMIHKLMKSGQIPNIPVYLDSPMAIAATHIFCDFHDEQALDREECKEIIHMTRLISDSRDSRRLMESDHPAIILSASGMATGGRVLHHLHHMAPIKKNTILFVGYQAPGTRGDILTQGAKFIKIHGDIVDVHAKVRVLESLSAHADYNETMSWLRKFNSPPAITFLNHGEADAAQAMKERIESELGWRCEIPQYNESFDLL